MNGRLKRPFLLRRRGEESGLSAGFQPNSGLQGIPAPSGCVHRTDEGDVLRGDFRRQIALSGRLRFFVTALLLNYVDEHRQDSGGIGMEFSGLAEAAEQRTADMLFVCDTQSYPRRAMKSSFWNNSVSCSFLSTAPYNGARTLR